MPYITQQQRDRIDAGAPPADPGELNYAITALILKYVNTLRPITYGTINAVVGALECAKVEFYRRVAVDYENQKVAANGDVY